MPNPTKAQIDQWNAAVKELAEREGIDEELAAARLIRLLTSDKVQDDIRIEVDERLNFLEARVTALEQLTQYIPEDPTASPQ
jgi:hypothetical protein